jgi:hypothetical protein
MDAIFILSGTVYAKVSRTVVDREPGTLRIGRATPLSPLEEYRKLLLPS